MYDASDISMIFYKEEEMPEEEIAEILKRPFDEIWQLCHRREGVRLLLSLAIASGISKGLQDAHTMTNQAFRGYTEVTLGN